MIKQLCGCIPKDIHFVFGRNESTNLNETQTFIWNTSIPYFPCYKVFFFGTDSLPLKISLSYSLYGPKTPNNKSKLAKSCIELQRWLLFPSGLAVVAALLYYWVIWFNVNIKNVP